MRPETQVSAREPVAAAAKITLADWLSLHGISATWRFRVGVVVQSVDLGLSVQDTNFVLKSYLFDLREKKILESPEGTAHPGQIEFTGSDLDTYPLLEFSWQFHKDVGTLHITSEPAGADAYIDHRKLSKPTPVYRLLSPDDYLVDIHLGNLNCEHTVHVYANRVTNESCPPGGMRKKPAPRPAVGQPR